VWFGALGGGVTDDQAKRIEEKLDLLLSVIVVQQKDVAEIAGVTDDTIRNHVKRGKLNVLQRES
jgi:hypothetical protein